MLLQDAPAKRAGIAVNWWPASGMHYRMDGGARGEQVLVFPNKVRMALPSEGRIPCKTIAVLAVRHYRSDMSRGSRCPHCI